MSEVDVTVTAPTEAKFECTAAFTFLSLHLSSCHCLLSLSAGSAGDREAAAHRSSMNDLTERETRPLPQKMKEARE